MKKCWLIAYITVFISACLLPTLVMIIDYDVVNNYGNQDSEIPSMLTTNGFNTQFPVEFESYFSNNFGMRKFFISVYSAIQYYTIKNSANYKVIVGKDGWLFFHKTLDDYLGRENFSEIELSRLYRTLNLQYEYLLSKGISFVVVIAPNKNSIYEEFMPDRYEKITDINNLKLVNEYLENKDIPYVDLIKILKEAKLSQQVYHEKDTHWNNYGALIAYRNIMEKIKEQNPNFQYDEYLNLSYEYKENWKGDLDAMLMPYFELEESQIVFNTAEKYRFPSPIRSLLDINITSESDINNIHMLMFRDSFANALIPFISNTFGHVHYTRAIPYDYSLIDEENPQVVILEIAERNLADLIKKTPVLPAPKRNNIPSHIKNCKELKSELHIESTDKHIRIFGWAYLKEYFDKDYQIYIQLFNDNNNFYFEPFPILESAFDEEAKEKTYLKNTGFSMILNKEELPKGIYKAKVIIKKNRAFLSSMDSWEVRNE